MASCVFCKAKFENYSELNKHIDKKHPPSCEHCKATFESYFELNQHKATKHPELKKKRTYANPLGPPSRLPKASTTVKTIEELSNLKDPSMYFIELHEANPTALSRALYNEVKFF